MTLKGFILGLVVGALLTAGLFTVRPPGARAPASASPAPSGGVSPSDKSGSASELEARLAASQRANQDLQRTNDELKGRVAHLEATQQKDPDDRTGKADPATPAKPETPPNPSDEIPVKDKLRRAIQVGAPLSDEAAAYLGLDPGQREGLDALLAGEGKRMYGFLRQIAGEQKDAQVPKEDGPMVLIAALGPSMQKDFPKLNDLFKDEAVVKGHKKVYLDEVLGADSNLVRLVEGLDTLRGGTMGAAWPLLREDQKEKFAELFRRNYSFGGGQISFPENIVARKP